MRMQSNPATPKGYHGGQEHLWTKGCDAHPQCHPIPTTPPEELEAARIHFQDQITELRNIVAAERSYDPPPSHYAADGIQPWDVVDAFGLDYYTGNVLKYLLRAGKKDIAPRLDDLKKARNYLNKSIELEEGRG